MLVSFVHKICLLVILAVLRPPLIKRKGLENEMLKVLFKVTVSRSSPKVLKIINNALKILARTPTLQPLQHKVDPFLLSLSFQ